MITRVFVTDVLRDFSDLIHRVAYRRERFVLVRDGKPMAELGPVPTGTRLGELESLLESLPRLGEMEARALAEDMAASREGLGL